MHPFRNPSSRAIYMPSPFLPAGCPPCAPCLALPLGLAPGTGLCLSPPLASS
jgi:hypothetical protein